MEAFQGDDVELDETGGHQQRYVVAMSNMRGYTELLLGYCRTGEDALDVNGTTSSEIFVASSMCSGSCTSCTLL